MNQPNVVTRSVRWDGDNLEEVLRVLPGAYWDAAAQAPVLETTEGPTLLQVGQMVFTRTEHRVTTLWVDSNMSGRHTEGTTTC